MPTSSTRRHAVRRGEHGTDHDARPRSVSLRALTVAAYLERSYVPRTKDGHTAGEDETASET
ncbi:MAG: hypothetical protein GEV11_25755 [Streptosporangiales bacterium]|nr:hypothetical protein [Streptosporangiales bacterium]